MQLVLGAVFKTDSCEAVTRVDVGRSRFVATDLPRWAVVRAAEAGKPRSMSR